MPRDIVKGDKKLIRRLNKLSGTIQRKIARSAVSAGATVVRKAIKAAAPDPEVKKNIVKRARSYAGDGNVIQVIGVASNVKVERHGRKDFALTTIASDLEFGSPERKIPAQPFIRPAWESSKRQAAKKVESKAWEGIKKQVRRK